MSIFPVAKHVRTPGVMLITVNPINIFNQSLVYEKLPKI